MEKIKTATGREILTDHVAENDSPRTLYVRCLGMKKADVLEIFDDPAETAILEYAGQKIYGYTILAALIDEGDAIRVNLRRP